MRLVRVMVIDVLGEGPGPLALVEGEHPEDAVEEGQTRAGPTWAALGRGPGRRLRWPAGARANTGERRRERACFRASAGRSVEFSDLGGP